MHSVFNLVMRIFSSLLGLAAAFMGAIWFLQGINFHFSGPFEMANRSFMVANPQWIVWGALLTVLGLCQIFWSNTRAAAPKS